MESKPNTIPDDEIDLKSIASRIFSILIHPVRLLLSNIKTTLLFILLAVLLSISLKYSIKKTYKSAFIIRPNDAAERIHLKMLGDIETLLKLRDMKAISRELKITEEVAKTISGIKVVNHTYAKIPADSSNSTSVELELTDFNQLLPMQTAIMAYLEENPHLNKIKAFQKLNIELKTKLIERDIVLLDSLKLMQLNSYNKIKVAEQNSVFLKDLIDPTSTYTLSLERLNQKTGLIAQSMFLDSFQLVKGVVVSEKPVWPPRILVMCFYLVPVFLILCLLLLYTIELRRKILTNRV